MTPAKWFREQAEADLQQRYSVDDVIVDEAARVERVDNPAGAWVKVDVWVDGPSTVLGE